jgi:hypothetical protein
VTQPTDPNTAHSTQFPIPPQEPIRPVYVRPAALNLDTLEREGGATDPFDFVLEGKMFLASDPQDIDWQDLMASFNNPHMFFRLILPAEDHRAFFEARLPSWKMRVLMDRYQKHFGIPDLPNAAGLLR